MILSTSRLFWLLLLLVSLVSTVNAADSAPSGNSSSPSTSPTTSPSTDSSPSSTPTSTPTSPSSSPSPTDTPTTSPTDTPQPKPSPTDTPTDSPTSPNPQPNTSPSDTNTPAASPSNSPSQGAASSPSSQAASSVSGSSFVFSSSGFQTLSLLSSGLSSTIPSKPPIAPSPSSTNTLCIADASGANNTCASTDQYCDTTSSFCLPKLQNGAACSADTQCTSNTCQNQLCAVVASSAPSVGVIIGAIIGGLVGLTLIIFIARKYLLSNNGFDDDNEYEHEVRAHTPTEFDGAASNGSFFGGLGMRRGSDPNVAAAKRRGRGITPSMVIEASHPEMQEMSDFANIGKAGAMTTVATPNVAYVAPVTSHHDREMDSHRPAQSTGQKNWQEFQPTAVDAPSKRRSVYNVLSGALAQMRNGQSSPLVEEDEDAMYLTPAKITDIYRSSVESTRQKELQSQQKFLEKFVSPKASAGWPVAEIMAEPRTSKGISNDDTTHKRHPSNISTANASIAANTKHQSNTSLGGRSHVSSIYPSIGDYQDEEMLPQIHQSALEAVMSEEELEQPPSFNKQDVSRQSTDSDIINEKTAKYSSNNPFADSAKTRPDSGAAAVGTSIAAQRQLRQMRERDTFETLAPEKSKRAISRYSTNSDYSEYEASSVRSSMAFDEEVRQSVLDNHLSQSTKYESGVPMSSADVTTAMKASPADAQKVIITPPESEPAAPLESQVKSSLKIPSSVASNTRKEELATLDEHLRGMSQDLGFRLSSLSMDDNPDLKETLSGGIEDPSLKRLSTKFGRQDVVDWDGMFED